MSREAEIELVQKAAMCDLMKILRGQRKQHPAKTCAYEELESLIDACLAGTDSQGALEPVSLKNERFLNPPFTFSQNRPIIV